MNYYRIFLLVLLVFAHCGAVYSEYSTNDLIRMTIDGLSYDVEADTVLARGVGKIMQGDAMNLILARRAAITDAQRGLLILRRGIREGTPPSPESVSGYLPPFRILSEDIRDGLYFVEIEAVLSELMEEDY